MDHSSERDLLESILGRKPQRYAGSNPKPAVVSRAPRKLDSGVDSGLLASMAARLAKVEARNQQLGQQVAAQNNELVQLRTDKAALQQVTVSVKEGTASQLLQERTEEVAELKEQVASMKQVLEQYGLNWDPSSKKPSRWKAGGHVLGSGGESGSDDNAAYYHPDVDALLQRIALVNRTTENSDDLAVIPSNAGGVHSMLGDRKAREKASIKFAIFADGIMVRRGPFRPFSDAKARAIVEDLLDGWLPSEWQAAFPEGVIVDAVDRRTEQYDGRVPLTAPAEGGNRVMSMDELRAGPKSEAPMGKEEFLRRLPGAKVKDGNIVNVRADITALFDANSESKGGSSSSSSSSSSSRSSSSSSIGGGGSGSGGGGEQGQRQAMARAAEQRAAAKEAAELRANAVEEKYSERKEEKEVKGGDRGGDSGGGSGGSGGRGSSFSFDSCAGDSKEVHTVSKEVHTVSTSSAATGTAPAAPAAPTAVLQVRLPNGQPSIQLRLAYGTSVGQVMALIAERAPELASGEENGSVLFSTTSGGSKKPKYELRTAYPNRAYADPEQTIEAAGLVPNAALVLRKLPA
jgi:uncharacterized membrane protein YgcG